MELITQKRDIFGKATKTLRGKGLIPAELYGHGLENLHLSVPAKEFAKLFKQAGESTIIKLKVEDEKDFNVLVHDISKNALTDEISHIDFYSVRMDEKIKTRVPLEFIGESIAVKEQSGVLIKSMREVEVEALPADLPRHIQVDIGLISNIGNSILVKDLPVKKGVKLLVDPETAVATVIEMAKEEEVAAPVASVEDVKVETEEKKLERDREKEEKEEKK